MAKKNQQYSLRVDLFSEAVEDFKRELNNPSFTINFTKEKEYEYKVSISKNGVTSGLRCYVKANGQVSFRYENKPKYQKICKECKEYLVQNTAIEYNCSSFYTINGVSVEDLKDFVFLFSEIYSYQLEEKENKDETILCRYVITSEYREKITVSYYSSKKIVLQGSKNLPFIRFISLIVEIVDDLEDVVEVFDYEEVDIIDPPFKTDLKVYIPNNYEKIKGKIETLLTTSMLLTNRYIHLPDYSHNVYGGLRALEGLIKKRLVDEIGPFDHALLKNYFNKEDNKMKNNLGLPTKTINSLNKGYKLYKKNRHGLFHMDSIPDVSRTLDYSESVSLLAEILDVVGDICKNWE